MRPERKTTISIDEVDGIIDDIAKNGDGAQQMRALQMVRAREQATLTLPDPFTDAETIDRLSRLIKATGPTCAMLAYRKAFPRAQRPLNHSAPKVTEDDIGGIDRAALPKTLRALYKMFPEIKRPGTPKGYPSRAGLAVQSEWVKKMATRMILDREQSKLDMIATEAAPQESHEGVADADGEA